MFTGGGGGGGDRLLGGGGGDRLLDVGDGVGDGELDEVVHDADALHPLPKLLSSVSKTTIRSVPAAVCVAGAVLPEAMISASLVLPELSPSKTYLAVTSQNITNASNCIRCRNHSWHQARGGSFLRNETQQEEL